MKIRNVSCEQFAGVKNRDISFEDGINVVYGKNETGKTTLVNIISKVLFQKAKLTKKDKFKNEYFPTKNKNGTESGDSVDGEITFETDEGAYKLEKVWSDDSDSNQKLTTPSGDVFRDEQRINGILKKALKYGEGVYSDMLLSSQKSLGQSLKTILDSKARTDAKSEVIGAVSKAFAESDGISTEAIEKVITEKITELGKNWNFESGGPNLNGNGTRKTTGIGYVYEAYNELENSKNELESREKLEADFDKASKNYGEKVKEVEAAQKEYDNFNAYSGKLLAREELKGKPERLEHDIKKGEDVLNKWPVLTQKSEEAKKSKEKTEEHERKLKKEKANREILNKYAEAKEIKDELIEKEAELSSRQYPQQKEINAVRNAPSKIKSLENKLCKMNLSALVKTMGENRVEITSLRTGEPITVCEGMVSIKEAVKIVVPGVMEMQLTPADVDVDLIKKQISELEKEENEILSKYGAKDLDALEELVRKQSELQTKVTILAGKLKTSLGMAYSDFEELEEAAKEVPKSTREKAEIEKDILNLPQTAQIVSVISSAETEIRGFENDYGNVNALKEKLSKLKDELESVKQKFEEYSDIPEEFLNVTDPNGHLEKLKDTLDKKTKQQAEIRDIKVKAEQKLEFGEDSEALAEKVRAKEQKFEIKKEELAHWKHIEEVFNAQKEAENSSPLKDLTESFTKYLSVISDEKVSSEFTSDDKLDMNIYSGNKLLSYDILSEGTKETVSLAFRLAVLDHLFPDGGGVIVFDDPLTDMDAERAEQSCRLIKECAKRHQVIFLTCNEVYKKMLGGNVISF